MIYDLFSHRRCRCSWASAVGRHHQQQGDNPTQNLLVIANAQCLRTTPMAEPDKNTLLEFNNKFPEEGFIFVKRDSF